jgi:hypothetical protein
VAIDGDVAVIGARGDDDRGDGFGAAYVYTLQPPLPGDLDGDGLVGVSDVHRFPRCVTGPVLTAGVPMGCDLLDFDQDDDVDLADIAAFQRAIGCPE